MGLCKCPKKKVTNLFCFEHRVNVCEHCLVSNHSKCVVQSYLKWLQDSDYNPCCTLCNQRLDDESSGQCVRLLCYDVFHWRCLDAAAQQLPANTAPAGYACPICRSGVFPASNVVSPVADTLRKLLSQVNWARAGLGLPMIEEPAPPAYQSNHFELHDSTLDMSTTLDMTASTNTSFSSDKVTHNSHHDYKQHDGVQNAKETNQSHAYSQGQGYPSKTVPQHSTVHIDEGTYSRTGEKTTAVLASNSRLPKVFDASQDSHMADMSYDHDENKYKRRSAFQWLTKWFKSRTPVKQRKDPSSTFKKFMVILVIGLIGFITVVIIFSRLGRMATDADPFLDPMANPNIRIAHEADR